jgi:protein phosphatase
MGLLAAVADGMGGAAAGEIASREGLASVAMHMFGHWGRFPAEGASESELFKALASAASGASDSVVRYTDAERTARGMGSTLTATVVWNGHLYFVQVGDSRAYVFRRGELLQATCDQTLVNEMIASGMLSPEQAKTHPQRSMITQALGGPHPLRAVLGKVPLRRGDRVLLCSDGLHGEVSDEQLLDVFNHHYSPRKTLELMLGMALDHGGRDNITGLLLAMDDPALPLPLPSEKPYVIDYATEPGAKDGIMSRLGHLFTSKP